MSYQPGRPAPTERPAPTNAQMLPVARLRFKSSYGIIGIASDLDFQNLRYELAGTEVRIGAHQVGRVAELGLELFDGVHQGSRIHVGRIGSHISMLSRRSLISINRSWNGCEIGKARGPRSRGSRPHLRGENFLTTMRAAMPGFWVCQDRVRGRSGANESALSSSHLSVMRLTLLARRV